MVKPLVESVDTKEIDGLIRQHVINIMMPDRIEDLLLEKTDQTFIIWLQILFPQKGI